jgi:HK97 family phage major capsid protein
MSPNILLLSRKPLDDLKTAVRQLRRQDPDLRFVLTEKRKDILETARKIVGPPGEPRDLTPDQEQQVRALLREAEAIKTLIVEHDALPQPAAPEPLPASVKAEIYTKKGDSEMHSRIVKFGEFFTKALGTNLLASGGALVPDEAAREVLTALQAEAVAFRAGVRQVEATGNPIRFPRITSDPSASWIAENDQIPEADMQTGQLVATPRKLASRIVVSNELLADAATSPTIVELLFQRLVQSLALAFDKALFEGSGTVNEPLGLRDRDDIGVISMGTNGAAFSSLDQFAEALRLIETANGKASAVVMHPRTWGDLLKLKETSTSIRPVLIEAAGSPSEAPTRSIFGVPVFLTSQVSTTETQGTSTNATSVYVFDNRAIFTVLWASRTIGDRVMNNGSVEIRVDLDSSRLFDRDQSELRAVLRADVVVPHPTAVVRIKGVTPAS